MAKPADQFTQRWNSLQLYYHPEELVCKDIDRNAPLVIACQDEARFRKRLVPSTTGTFNSMDTVTAVATQIGLLYRVAVQQRSHTLQLTDTFINWKRRVGYNLFATFQAGRFDRFWPASESAYDGPSGEVRVPIKLLQRELTFPEKIGHTLHFSDTLLAGELPWDKEAGQAVVYPSRKTGLRPAIEVFFGGVFS